MRRSTTRSTPPKRRVSYGHHRGDLAGQSTGPLPDAGSRLGPRIIKRQIGKIFGKLLYGSKFHRLKQSRGQQGIGISAAGMYAQITTGRDIEVISKTGQRRPANRVVMRIDTKRNEPKFKSEEEVDWDYDHGTQIVMVMTAVYKGGKHGVAEFLRQTALSNPHAHIEFQPPKGERIVYERQVHELPVEPVEIQPYPHVEGF